MDQMRREVLRTSLTLLRVRNTPVLALKGTARTDTIGTTTQGMTGTRIGLGTRTDLGTNPRLISQEENLYVSNATSQATMPLVARTTRSLQRPKSNQFSRNTTCHQWLALSLVPDPAQRRLRLLVSQKTQTTL